MAAEARLFTVDDTLKALNEKIAKEGDTLWVKVQRRAHLGSPPTTIATLSGAVLQQITSPELWLPDLCGGGKLSLSVSHESNPGSPIGGAISVPIDNIEPRDIDFEAPKQANWRGPAKLEFPKRDTGRPQQQADMPLYAIHSPPAPGTGDSASRTQPETWARSAGGGLHRAQYGDDPAFSARAAGLEAERRKLEQDKLDAERERHRAEVDALKRSHESELKSVESRLMAKIDSIASKPTGPDPMMEFMKMQAQNQQALEARAAEDRRAERERQDRLDARASEDRRATEVRAAEDRKAERERQDRADARFEKVLEKMSEKKEKDPLEMMKTAKDLLKSDNEGMMKTIHSMAEMTSTMSGVAMDFVSAAADMQLGARGEDEPGWVKGVDKIVKGIGAMSRRPMAPPPQAPPQLLPQTQPQQPQAQQPQQPPAPKPAERELTIIEQFESAVRQHQPVEAVADALVKWIDDPSIQEALADAGGDPEQAIYKRLGNWSNENEKNAHYFRTLIAELEKRLQAAGQFEPESETDAEVDESEEGDEGGDE